MKKRLKSWARTLSKLVLLVLCYFWVGAAYKAIYAQTHDITRLKKKVPLPYYQQEFLVDSLIHQTWVLGPDFAQFIGEMPNLIALMGGNPFNALAEYFSGREHALATLPDRYPRSLYAEAALSDASSFFSQTAALLNLFSERERPRQAMTVAGQNAGWVENPMPDFARTSELSLRLANDYPDSPHAPEALRRVAESEDRNGRPEEARALYRRIAMEYPRSEEAQAAAQALYQQAVSAGKWDEARSYKRQALAAMERLARDRHPGKAIPPSETVNLLGYHVDLTGLNLQLRALTEARSELELAQTGIGRLAGIKSLDEGVKGDLKRVRERTDHATSELWVADLFQKMDVGVPGPPPRPTEHDVTGRVVVEGKPLPGVQVQLVDDPDAQGGGGNRGMRLGPFAFTQPARFQATTDKDGAYRMTGVASGVYRLRAVYPLIVERRPIVPQGLGTDENEDQSVGRVRVEKQNVQLPDLRFKQGVQPDTFGEVPPQGTAVRLQWQPLPGATSYRAEVRSTFMFAPLFQSRTRGGGPRPGQFGRPISLWKSGKVTGSSVDCPLLELAPDQPAAARAAQYQYVITAFDAHGNEITHSSDPLGRFHLSPKAVAALLEQHPPTRLGPGGRRRRGFFGRPQRAPQQDRSRPGGGGDQ